MENPISVILWNKASPNKKKQKTRGPLATSLTSETVPINKHNCTKQWLYHSINKKKEEYFHFENSMVDYLLKLESPSHKVILHQVWLNWTELSSPKNALCQVWLKLAQKDFFFILSMCFRYFVIFFPWSRTRPFICKNLNFIHQTMLCTKFGWNWPSGFGANIFCISSMYFCYFVIISPWKKELPFIWTNLNSLHPKMFCAKFDWNWPSGSEEEDENVKRTTGDQKSSLGKFSNFLHLYSRKI